MYNLGPVTLACDPSPQQEGRKNMSSRPTLDIYVEFVGRKEKGKEETEGGRKKEREKRSMFSDNEDKIQPHQVAKSA